MNNFPIRINTISEVILFEKTVSLTISTLLVLAGFALIAQLSPPVTQAPSSHAPENQVHFTSNAPSSQENGNLPAMTSKPEDYVVRTYDGKIGVFKNDEKTPYQMIDVEVSSLPQTDQLLLATGIRADNPSDLQQIIEDYES